MTNSKHISPASENRPGSAVAARALSLLVPALVILVIGFFLVRKVSEYDIWYHMAVGKELLRTWSSPATDPFCLLNAGEPFYARLWLFRTLTAAGFQVAGAWWLQFIQVALWGVTFWFVFRSTRVWTSATPAWLMLLVMALASSERFTIRPEIVSYALIAVYWWRLQQGKYRTGRELAVFFLLQELWTNSHGLFSIGPFLVGCYLLEALVRARQDEGRAGARDLVRLLAVILAGCLITPTGLDTLRYTWLLVNTVTPSAPMLHAMFELSSPLGEIGRDFTAFWFFLALLTGFALTLPAVTLLRLRQLPLARTLAVAVLLGVALTGIRNMPLFTVVATPLIAEYLRLLTPGFRRICAAATAAVIGIAALVWSPAPALRHLTVEVPYRFGLGLSPDHVPLGLPRFLDRIGFTAPVFNSQTLGGFYEYYGVPRRIPFYDFRLEDYELSRIVPIYKIAFNAKDNPAAWNTLLRQYDFKGILLENSSTAETAGILPLISVDPAWRLVYLDCAASFWLRTDYPELPPPVGKAEIGTLAAGVASAPQAENLDAFLERSGLYPDIRMQLLQSAVARWDNSLFLTDLGIMKLAAGNLAEAEPLFQRVLQHKPRSRQTLTTLAQIALNRGDAAAAADYLKRAIGFYPDDRELRENYDLVLKTLK